MLQDARGRMEARLGCMDVSITLDEGHSRARDHQRSASSLVKLFGVNWFAAPAVEGSLG